MESIRYEQLSLTEDEIRAYSRWYTDLLLRKGKESIVVGDVLTFVDNFGVKDEDKQKVSQTEGQQTLPSYYSDSNTDSQCMWPAPGQSGPWPVLRLSTTGEPCAQWQQCVCGHDLPASSSVAAQIDSQPQAQKLGARARRHPHRHPAGHQLLHQSTVDRR